MDFLHKREKYKNALTPDIIILDLNLPRKDGREVLEEIKNDDKLKSIPVVILSTSDDDRDIHKAYKNHANCYITKPVDLDQFIKVVQSFQSFLVIYSQIAKSRRKRIKMKNQTTGTNNSPVDKRNIYQELFRIISEGFVLTDIKR